MSCGLVPFGRDRERDMLERYQYIPQSGKESRQFGAQRRASEGTAADRSIPEIRTDSVLRIGLRLEIL